MIHERGYWIGEREHAQRPNAFDNNLSNALLDFFKKNKCNSLVDFGCGTGDYVNHFNSNGLKADGFDGNPSTPKLTKEICGVLDLSEPQKLNKEYDWAMSLEVGEHVPSKYESIFIENLHNNNNKGIVLSWAIEGQGGYGHFNERNNSYIKDILLNLGYINNAESENKLREGSSSPWFKITIMVFDCERKKAK